MKRTPLLMTLVTLVVLGGLVGGWYLVLWKPINQKLATLRGSIAANQVSLSQAIADLTSLQTESKHLPSLRAEVASLQSALPKTTDLQGFYSAVNNAASASGLPLINIAPTKPTAAAPVSGVATTTGSAAPSLAFSLQTEGGYFQIESLLLALDSLPRLVSISGVTLSTVGGSVPGYSSTDGVILNATITGQAFERTGS